MFQNMESKKRQISSSFCDDVVDDRNRHKRVLCDKENEGVENSFTRRVKPENNYVLTPRGILTLCHDVSASSPSSSRGASSPATPATVMRRPLSKTASGNLAAFNSVCGNILSPVGASTPLKTPLRTGNVEDAELIDVEKIASSTESSVCFDNSFNSLSWISRLFDDDRHAHSDAARRRLLPDSLHVPFNTVGRSRGVPVSAPPLHANPAPLFGLGNRYVREDSYRRRGKTPGGRTKWRRMAPEGKEDSKPSETEIGVARSDSVDVAESSPSIGVMQAAASPSTTSLSSMASTSSAMSHLSVSSWSEDDDDDDVSIGVEACEDSTIRPTNSNAADVSNDAAAPNAVAPAGEDAAPPRPTHVTRHDFVPRHDDELRADAGDALHLEAAFPDLWVQCVNLRTGARGVIPSAFLAPLEMEEEEDDLCAAAAGSGVGKEAACDAPVEGDVYRFEVEFLGSVEVAHHRGDEVLVAAIRQVARQRSGGGGDALRCLIEIHRNGIRITEKETPTKPLGPLNKLTKSVSRMFKLGLKSVEGLGKPRRSQFRHDYFFPLKNVSFCGFHPAVESLFAFITRHPVETRFAAHVVRTAGGSRGLAEAMGKTFEDSYQNMLKTMSEAVTEDIYLE